MGPRQKISCMHQAYSAAPMLLPLPSSPHHRCLRHYSHSHHCQHELIQPNQTSGCYRPKSELLHSLLSFYADHFDPHQSCLHDHADPSLPQPRQAPSPTATAKAPRKDAHSIGTGACEAVAAAPPWLLLRYSGSCRVADSRSRGTLGPLPGTPCGAELPAGGAAGGHSGSARGSCLVVVGSRAVVVD